jgi:crotonobetainyl-CoA:carnitine CoA-transferase CaiB-like acyl-CoA transferase
MVKIIMESNTSPALLENICVVDLTRVLAGPYCTMMLGDLGAEVIKIEMPGTGDDTRQWGPPFTESGESAYFLSANRNKRSLTLNLKTDQGLEILKQIIAKADILVENFKTGTLEKWGLDFEALQRIKPDLIYCTITGYGYTGPYKNFPGYDFMVQALSGFMSVTGPVDGDPVRAGIAIADLATGIFASNAILASLFARERTGQGQRIDMALLDSQVAMMSYVASNYLVSGEVPGRLGNGHPNIVPYQSFQARDQYFALAAGNDRQWGKLCTALGREEWITDNRYAANRARVENRKEVVALLNQVFIEKDAAEWIKLCEEIGIPAAPINDISQVFTNPQVIARNLKLDVAHPVDVTVPQVASPLNIPTNPVSVRYPPPLLGEHTDQVLSEYLDFEADKISELRDQGIV